MSIAVGKCVDEFEAHKSSKEHFEAQAREEKACFCRLCRKQFTSPAQIAEHLKVWPFPFIVDTDSSKHNPPET
jgi:hypothetical protein